jgi:hypothetical protein
MQDLRQSGEGSYVGRVAPEHDLHETWTRAPRSDEPVQRACETASRGMNDHRDGRRSGSP